MRNHTFARMRSVAGLILLLTFGATLLPTHSASAEEQVVVIPKEELQAGLWKMYWGKKVHESKWLPPAWKKLSESEWLPAAQIESILSDEFVIRSATGGGSALLKDIDTFQKNYRREVGLLPNPPSYEQSVYLAFVEASRIPAFKGELPSIAGVLLTSDSGRVPVNSKDQVATGTSLAFTSEDFGQYEADQKRRVIQQTRQDPQFAVRYDKVNKERLGASVSELDDVGKFIRDHPDAAIPPKIAAALRPDGSVAISLKDLNELARTEFGKIHDSIDDLQTTVDAINAKQDVLLDYVLDERERQAAQALAEAKAQEHRLKLQVAGSAVNIISTLAGYIDPEVGKQISVIGGSLIQVADAYTSWTKAVAGLGTLDALTSLGTAAMTGNVIGAVLNVVSLFGPSQPSPEQMILEQIGKLREQVSQLRTEMHDRFDRVDAQLNTIYTTMQDRLDKIDLRLGKIDGNVQEIQQTLVRLDQTLSRIERNSFEFLDATNRRPLLNAINGALGYKERTGRDMPYQPDFLAYENDFHSWGTIYAFDALSAGPTQRDYNDEAVLAELSAYPLDVNINYLNGWLVAHGMQPFATKRLPGPRDWLFASRAYAQLGLEWPQHAAQIKPERQAALDAVGKELEQAMRNISTRLTADGPQGNAPLFTAIISHYNQQLGAFDAGLQATQAAFVQQHAGNLGRSTPFGLYSGVDQLVNHTPAEMTTMTCANERAPLPTPIGLKNVVPNYSRTVLADYLKARMVKVCVGGEWLDPITPPCPFFPCPTFAFHRAKISVYVGTTLVARHSSDTAAERQRVDVGVVARTIEGWEQPPFYKRQFEALFANASPPAASAADITKAIEDTLLSLQQAFDQHVKSEMRGGSLKDDALALAGAKKLLESFVALGMPQALESDDLLRSLLYSNQSLTDDQQVMVAYTRPISPTQLTVNPRLALMATAKKRHEALGALLTRYTDAINAKTYSERITLIGDTRLRMRLALILAGVEPTPGGKQRRLYLPLVRR